MRIDDTKLEEALVRENYVSQEEIEKNQKLAHERHVSLGETLITEGLVSKELIGQAMAEFYHAPFADISVTAPDQTPEFQVPESIAQRYRTVFFVKNKSALVYATDDPRQQGLAEELTKYVNGQKIVLAYALPEDIDQALLRYQKTLVTRFSQIIKEKRRIAPEILEQIFSDAFAFHASDIHFEPTTAEVLVRFRVDGVLREAGRLPKEPYENILNRIKVQSRIRIDEHFSAQDGSMRIEQNGLIIDLRTSIIPTIEGEKVVLRVLSAYTRGHSLSDLGLSAENEKVLNDAVRKPFGMILVVGPTGSGKTTSLYSLVKMLHRPEVNITTIEDPVEYKIDGINQIQVNPLTNLTFSAGLKSIVRQDPDIVLVGEIRDQETAQIAVNAALTGHLILSTFHANDAATALPRLLDMHVEPFLLASTIQLIVAQRLVRRICESCRHSVTIDSKKIKSQYPFTAKYLSPQKMLLYEGKGCDVCNGSGYKGRVAIFEFIRNTPEMQELILKSPSNREIWALAASQGATSLFEDGLEKVKTGLTTIEELLRVAPPPFASI